MISNKAAEHYIWGQNCDGWHLVKTAGLSVIHERMPPESKEARHYHAKSRQFFFVLSGVLTLEIDGKREVLQKNEGAEIPPGATHQIFNQSELETEFLVVSQPASHSDRFSA